MEVTTELTIRALTPEQRLQKEAELAEFEAESGVCLSCSG